jgi:hypothetical protein
MSVRRKSYRSWPIIGNVSMAKGFAPHAVHHVRKEEAMLRRASRVVLVPLLLHVGIVSAQESYPIMERVAQKIIQHYQSASCQDLAQQQNQLITLVQPGTNPYIKEPGDLTAQQAGTSRTSSCVGGA